MSGAGGGDGAGERSRTAARIALTALSASSAETWTFPIDIVKTHPQLRRGSGGAASRFAGEIWRQGGAQGFYRGLPPAILRHIFYTPIRIVGYEHLRGAVGSDGGTVTATALAGGLSGVLAQIVASPADLIKVRMQADSRLISQGLQPRYTGIFDAFTKIIRNESFLGLRNGVFPNAQIAFLVNMGELACYDHAKRFIISRKICEDNFFAHSLASVASGLSATALSCPSNVVKTRMMNGASGKEASLRYRNSYDCLVKTVKSEGMLALWKGFFSTWAWLGPWRLVFWVSYERLRHVSGLSSF